MQKGVYFKSWTGTKNGEPPTAGGGGGGHVRNVHLKNFTLDRVILPLQLYQTNGGHSYVQSPLNCKLCSVNHSVGKIYHLL